MKWRFPVAALLGAWAAACAPPEPPGLRTGPIFGGTLAPDEEAVVGLVQFVNPTTIGGACSATIIATSGSTGFALTAAHCLVERDATGLPARPPRVLATTTIGIVPGADWKAGAIAGHYFIAAALSVHPQYDATVDSAFDVGVVRFGGAAAATLPFIAPLAPTEDTLAVGSTVTLVGYGKTEVDASNTQRRKVDRKIESLTASHLVYDQTDLKGQCKGDSGGPALFQAAAGRRVAGVVSYGDAECKVLGVDVRVSSVAAFIQSVVNAGVPPDAGADAGKPPTTDGGAPEAGATEAGGARDSGAAPEAGAPPPPPICGGLQDVRPACNACLVSRCCMEAAICAADPVCKQCGSHPLPSCRFYPPAATLATCLARCDDDPCAVGVPDAGPAPSNDAAAPTDTSGPDDSSSDPVDAEPPRVSDATSEPEPPLEASAGAPDATAPPVDAAPPPEPVDARDAARPPDGAVDRIGPPAGSSGCGCDAGRAGATPGGVALLVAAVLLAARRTRRRASRTSSR